MCILHCHVFRLCGYSFSDGVIFRYDVDDLLLVLGVDLKECCILEE